MRQMTLDQIDLEGNGFHEALDAFIIFHTMESLGKLKSMDAASLLYFQACYTKGNYNVKFKYGTITFCNSLLALISDHVLVTSTTAVFKYLMTISYYDFLQNHTTIQNNHKGEQ